jgi:hypothetical protein
MPDQNDTIMVRSSQLAEIMNAPDMPSGSGGSVSQEMETTAVWSDALLQRAGIPVTDVPFVTIGGGMGGFIMTDYLRIAGVPSDQIKVLSNIAQPYQTYEYLTRVSQIPRGEILRSDSSSSPDNIWGWPSLGYRAAWKEKSIAPLWSLLVEPIFTDYWTPKAGQVFESLDRESKRIGYHNSLVQGNVRQVRKRDGGGYFVIFTPPAGSTPTHHVAFRCKWVHIAVGYPGLKFLPDLQEYRQKYQEYSKVVNAYEPHEAVYEGLKNKPGVVLIRGGGIVASRVLQRLMEDRWNKGAQTTILHLFRTYVEGPERKAGNFGRRRGGHGWAYQGFNWPKSAWGGQWKQKFERAEGEERKKLYQELGGAHTPYRRLWQDQMKKSRAEGWYSAMQGEVVKVERGPSGEVISTVKTKNGSMSEVRADYVIDATGLEGDMSEHRLFADLLKFGGIGRNPLGRLDVERNFEVRGARSGEGRMYAAGSMTLGGYYAGVDTFLGLQYANLQVLDELAKQGFCKYLGVRRNFTQWLKWARNKSI